MNSITFNRSVPYLIKNRDAKGLHVFEDQKGNIYLQPIDFRGFDGKHFVAFPKEQLGEIIEVLKELRNE